MHALPNRRYWRTVKRPFKVTQGYSLLCQSMRIYDFLLALSSNLTFIFNCSWDITPSLDIHTPPLFQVELKKTTRSKWTCFGVTVLRTLDHPTVKLNPRKRAPYDHNVGYARQGRIKVRGGPRLDTFMGPYPSFISYYWRVTAKRNKRVLESVRFSKQSWELVWEASVTAWCRGCRSYWDVMRMTTATGVVRTSATARSTTSLIFKTPESWSTSSTTNTTVR